MSKDVNNRIYLESLVYNRLSCYGRAPITNDTVSKINKVPFNILERISTLNAVNMYRFINRMR